MSLLLESIKLINGEFRHLHYHEQRMNRSLKARDRSIGHINLEKLLEPFVRPTLGLFKCRVVYDEKSQAIEFEVYEPKVVNTLQVVNDDSIEYGFKYADRRNIAVLYEKRNTCDDIIIVKAGMVTDSSYANLVFRRGEKWYTPDTPLLPGVMRAVLLDGNIIEEKAISVDNLNTFESFKLINAMLEFDSPECDISNIVI